MNPYHCNGDLQLCINYPDIWDRNFGIDFFFTTTTVAFCSCTCWYFLLLKTRHVYAVRWFFLSVTFTISQADINCDISKLWTKYSQIHFSRVIKIHFKSLILYFSFFWECIQLSLIRNNIHIRNTNWIPWKNKKQPLVNPK